jgi:hypothetical protein
VRQLGVAPNGLTNFGVHEGSSGSTVPDPGLSTQPGQARVFRLYRLVPYGLQHATKGPGDGRFRGIARLSRAIQQLKGGTTMTVLWRVTPDGEKQWQGSDGYWYPIRDETFMAGVQQPVRIVHSQPPPIYGSSRTNTTPAGGFLAVAAGVAIVIGAFLPWVSLRVGFATVSRNSVQLGANEGFSIDGVVLLGFGVIVAMIGVAALTNSSMPRWLQRSAIVPGIGAVAVCLNRYFPLHSDVAHATSALVGLDGAAAVGYGIYIVAAGGFLAVLSGLILRSR